MTSVGIKSYFENSYISLKHVYNCLQPYSVTCVLKKYSYSVLRHGGRGGAPSPPLLFLQVLEHYTIIFLNTQVSVIIFLVNTGELYPWLIE